MDYKIRFATPDDHDLIYALKAESVRPYVEKIWGWDEGYQKKDFDGDFSHIKQFNVIEVDGSFAGFVQYYFEYPYFEVVEIHLLPEYRGKGIGSDILRYLQKVCIAQDRKIRIGCFKENHRAKALYQKLGFMQTEETDTHYILEYPNYIAENNRIAFVQYTHEDDGDMFACWQDRDTQKGYNYAFDGSLDDLISIDITAFPFWVVAVDKASGAKIGVLRLSSGEEQDLAIWIYPNYRGRGYGTDAFSLAVDYIFRNMNLRKIYAGCYCDNKASLRMLEKVGFIRYPAGDQQEENCFTGEPTTQLSFVLTINDGIHATNDYERCLFGAVKERFSDNLHRWFSEVRPDHYNSNFFTPISNLTRQDILAAVAFQKQRGINEVMFSTNYPVDLSIMDGYDCVEYSAYVMAMLSDRSHLWQTNDEVEIRDIQTHDISADILDVSDVPEKHREAAYRNMKMVLEVAKTHREYHWLCAYKDGKRVGTAYAVEHNGFVEMDDLWVAEEYRHQRIATTIMKHIVDHTDGIIYLHATANATPKDMYAKMGFEIVETVYEYYLEW